MSKKMKTILIVVVIVVGIIGARMNFLSEEEVTTKEPEVEVNDIEYEIVQRDDDSTPNATRLTWHVIIDKESTEEEIKKLSSKIVEEAKDIVEFNALSLGFYDNADDIGQGYTLGSVDYAPWGDWGRASEVGPGNYSKSEYKYDLK